MALDSRQIQYTVKIVNDPSNVAAANAAAAQIQAILGGTAVTGSNLYTKAQQDAQNAEKARMASAQEQAAKLKANNVMMLAQIKEQQDATRALAAEEERLHQSRLRQAQQVNTHMVQTRQAHEQMARNGGAGGGFLAGMFASGNGKSAESESVRVNDQGHFRLNLFSRLNAFVDLAIAGIIGNKILGIADNFAELTGKIRVNTDTENQAVAVREALLGVSLRTHTSLKENVEAWEKLQVAGANYHLTGKQVIQTQETLLKGMQVSGASPERAQESIRMFTMALNSGRASSIAFRQIFRNAPELMNDLSKATGIALNQFSKLSKEGSDGMRKILEGLRKIGPEIDEKFAKLPVTMRKGFQDAKTSFEDMVGKITEKMQISGGMGSFFERLSSFFQDPKIINAIAGFVNVLGTALLKALNVAADVIDYFSKHADQLRAIMELLAVSMGLRVVTAFTRMIVQAKEGVTWLDLLKKSAASATKELTGLSLVQEAQQGAGGGSILSRLGGAMGFAKKAGVASTASKDVGALANDWVRVSEAATGAANATKGVAVATEGVAAAEATVLLINPWTAAIAGVVALGGALWIFGDQMDASGRKAYTVKDVIIGAFDIAKNKISEAWGKFVPWWNDNVWSPLVKGAEWAAGKIQGILDGITFHPKVAGGNDPGFLGIAGLARTIHNHLPSWMTTDITGMANDAIEASGQQGKFDRTFAKIMGTGIDPSEFPTALPPPHGGAPLGGPDKKKGNNKAADARRALQDMIDKLKETLGYQNALNDAIFKGPDAVRAEEAAQAGKKVRLEELQKLEKAGLAVKKNGVLVAKSAADAAKVEEAAGLAVSNEIAKQTAERHKAIETTLEQNKLSMEQNEITKKSLVIWTADVNLRQKRAEAMARETAEAKKRAELLKQHTKLDTHDFDAIKSEGDKAVSDAKLKDYQAGVQAINSLLETKDKEDNKGIAAWREQVRLIQLAAKELHLTEKQIEDINEQITKMKPPENLVESLRGAFLNWKDDFEMGWDKVQEGIKGSISNLTNGFVEMAVTGKGSFKQLALSIVQDLERMILKALLFKAIMGIMDAVFPGLGTASKIVGTGSNFLGLDSGMLSTIGSVAGKGHAGGIVGMGADTLQLVSSGAFSSARKFHTGGIAGLMGGEVPIIAKRGEAIMPTVRMSDGSFGVRAVGGAGGAVFAPNININLKGGNGGGGAGFSAEQQHKLGQLFEDELNTHLQRKLEQWMRPGGPLQRLRQ